MIARGAGMLVWTLLLMPVQTILLRFDGSAKQRLPTVYWSGIAWLLGLKFRIVGKPAFDSGQSVLFISNHSSWIDIVALGSVLPGSFVAKGEIARWPGFNHVARAGRTMFISRSRANTARERRELASRLADGDNLILFPEGTTSDGARVLPFHSSFLALAELDQPPIIQPVTLVYDQMDGLPVCRRNRPMISWYGDMDIVSHYAQLGRHNLRVTIVFDPPIDARIGRKRLSTTLERNISNRAAEIRQGRN
ncbi:MAG TPA: lysophospholipid acyltransferase family protein [Acidiphilium sp.]